MRAASQTVILSLKALAVASLFIFIRAILPRYKYTDVLQICWQILIPFIAFYIFIFFLIFLCVVGEVV